MRVLFASVTAFAIIASAGQAYADPTVYIGIHPRSQDSAHGFCYIEVPHVHAEVPAKKIRPLYRKHEGAWHYVGDPVAYGYDGPRHAYYGHHPVQVDVVVGPEQWGHDPEFCYLDGPHYHSFEPAGPKFEVKAGAYWYVGPLPPAYKRDKKLYARSTAVLKPVVYERPEVVVDAPPVGYVGPFVEVRVGVPAPPTIRAGIGLEVGIPGVVVVDDHRHHGKHKKFKRHGKHKVFVGKHKPGRVRYKAKSRGGRVFFKAKGKGKKGRGR